MASESCLTGSAGPARAEDCVNSPEQTWTYLDGQLRTGAQGERCLTNEDDGLATVTFCRSGDPKQFWQHTESGQLVNDVARDCLTQPLGDTYTFLEACDPAAPEQRWEFTPVA